MTLMRNPIAGVIRSKRWLLSHKTAARHKENLARKPLNLRIAKVVRGS